MSLGALRPAQGEGTFKIRECASIQPAPDAQLLAGAPPPQRRSAAFELKFERFSGIFARNLDERVSGATQDSERASTISQMTFSAKLGTSIHSLFVLEQAENGPARHRTFNRITQRTKMVNKNQAKKGKKMCWQNRKIKMMNKNR